MIERVLVRTGVGVHARPAALLVKEAARYGCAITLEYRDKKADARSILEVLALGVKDGEELAIRAEGQDQEAALAALTGILSTPE